jgi:leucyl aminopeptidase
MTVAFEAVARAQLDPGAYDGVGRFLAGRDAEPGAGLGPLAERSGFRAEAGEVLRSADGDRVVATVGLGAAPDLRGVVRAAAVVGRALRHCERIAVEVPRVEQLDAPAVARAVAEGISLGTYRFAAHKSSPRPDRLAHVALAADEPAAAVDALAIARPITSAVALARNLANETPARLTAARLADLAVSVGAESGVAVEVWDERNVAEERLGCLMAVNAGSLEPPRVIRLEHAPDGAPAHVVLVGKGITFDSGGLSLKRPASMYDMKGDMGGAAAVIAALGACRALGVGVRVTGIVLATDNLPGPGATKPGEIVTARDGTTVEILDTDAEGRLVLADGLCLAAELAPTAVVDVATLTGYARVLGPYHTPLMANDDALRDRIAAAAAHAGELVWPLPLPDAYVDTLESPIADLRNIPDPDDGGTVAPGVFLRHFAGDAAWAHLDIGETGFASKDDGEVTKGCTGAMVRTLCELLRTW